MLCKAPSSGMTIDPQGNIQMCCSSDDKWARKKITEIDSLESYWLESKEYIELRNRMATKNSIVDIPECYNCHKLVDGLRTEQASYKDFDIKSPLSIKYLEVTFSNICNQSCVMCSPYFSTKLVKLHKQTGYMGAEKAALWTLSDESIGKIMDVLPGLEVIQIKGGEPFADRNNLRILERLLLVNPECKVIIITNGTSFSKEFIKVFQGMKNVTISLSIDGTDDVYKWVRGTDFNNTIESVNMFYEETGHRFHVQTAITAYTLSSTIDIHSQLSPLDSIRAFSFINIVDDPDFLSPAMLDDDDFDNELSKIVNYFGALPWYIRQNLLIKNLYFTTPYVDGEREKLMKAFMNRTKIFNKFRGFNIEEHVPVIKNLINKYN